MATIIPTYQFLKDSWIVTWANMANGDIGEAVRLMDCIDRNVQVEGTFGASGNCRIEGSNLMDGSPTFRTLNDGQGNALNIIAAGIKQILENTHLTRPNITAGDGTTSLTVRIKGAK